MTKIAEDEEEDYALWLLFQQNRKSFQLHLGVSKDEQQMAQSLFASRQLSIPSRLVSFQIVLE